MNRFDNQFRTSSGMEKRAMSIYDSLLTPNRELEKKLNVSSFSPNVNEDLNSYIKKTASEIEENELFKQAGEMMDKEAFFSGGMDLFARTKQFISNKLGVSDEIAHNLTSPVLNRTDLIRNQHGGEETRIIEGVVEQMGTSLMEQSGALGGVSPVNMKPIGTKQWSEQVKQRLIQEIGMSSYDAERTVRLVVKESQDLTTMLRPHTKYEISDAIIEMMKEHQDETIIYGLKDSGVLMDQLKSYLQS